LKTDGTNLEVVYSSHTFNVNDFVVEPYSTVILKVDNVDFKIEIDR
jgi:hypothetical protein